MRYRGEVMREGRVVKAATFNHATHPSQVVRILLDRTPFEQGYANVFVLNDEGQLWKYAARPQQGRFFVMPPMRQDLYLDRMTMETVFAGNMSIQEAVANG